MDLDWAGFEKDKRKLLSFTSLECYKGQLKLTNELPHFIGLRVWV